MSTYDGIQIPIEFGSNGLQKSVGDIDSVLEVLNKINKSVTDIRTNMGNVGDKMRGEFKKAEQGAESLVDKLGKVGLAIQGIQGIARSVMGAVQPIFEEGLSREASVAGLKTLLGTKEEAESYAKELRGSLMSGLYGSGTVTDAARTMMSFGIDKNKTMEMLKSIGDIAGGNQQSFNSLVLAFSQATSLGKLQGQDKLQMIGAGFNPLTQIAEDLGISVADVDDMMSKGLIDADTLAKAFANAAKEGGTYFGAMKEQMGGLNGMTKTFQSSLADLFAEIYKAIKPVAESVLPPMIGILQEAITLVPELTTFIEALAVATGTLGSVYAVYWAWQNKSIIATKMQIYWLKVLDAVQKVTFGGWILAITAVVSLINSLITHWDYVKKAFTDGGILHGIMAIGKVILDAILSPIQYLLELLSNIPGLGKLAGKGAGYLAELRSNLFGGITPGVEGDSAMGGGDGKGNGPKGLSNVAASGVSSVATGGTRNTSITINMGSLVHQISYNGGIEKNSRETTQDLQEALLRVLNAAVATAG